MNIPITYTVIYYDVVENKIIEEDFIDQVKAYCRAQELHNSGKFVTLIDDFEKQKYED